MALWSHSLFRAVVNPPAAIANAISSSSPSVDRANLATADSPQNSNIHAPTQSTSSNASVTLSNHYVTHSSASLSSSACPVMHHQKEGSNLSATEIAGYHQHMHANQNSQTQTQSAHQHSYPHHPATVGGNALAGGCPVPHNQRHPSSSSNSSSSSLSSPSSSSALPATTSATATATATATANQSSSVSSDSASVDVREPPDSSDNIIGGSHSSSSYLSARQDSDLLIDSNDVEGEKIPDSLIPASGRGNSEDGANWINPSANQLYRALKRKNKPIEKEDALSVSAIHEWVTNGTWAEILKVEQELYPKCPPKLIRFQGQDGNYSWKAWWVSKIMGKSSLPFDRHDWYIQRCDKEIKYIIDYYSYEIKAPGEKNNNETYTVYTIDARPAPTFGGMVDRARIAWRRWKKGEEWW